MRSPDTACGDVADVVLSCLQPLLGNHCAEGFQLGYTQLFQGASRATTIRCHFACSSSVRGKRLLPPVGKASAKGGPGQRFSPGVGSFRPCFSPNANAFSAVSNLRATPSLPRKQSPS